MNWPCQTFIQWSTRDWPCHLNQGSTRKQPKSDPQMQLIYRIDVTLDTCLKIKTRKFIYHTIWPIATLNSRRYNTFIVQPSPHYKVSRSSAAHLRCRCPAGSRGGGRSNRLAGRWTAENRSRTFKTWWGCWVIPMTSFSWTLRVLSSLPVSVEKQ